MNARRLILALLAAVMVILGSASTASAGTGSDKDPKNDADARIDVTDFRVENDDRWFTMRVEVRNLRQKGKFNFFYEWGARQDGEIPHPGALIAVRRTDGETKARFLGCSSEDCSEEPGEECHRLKVSWSTAKDFIRVAAPQKCLLRTRENPDQAPPKVGTFSVYAHFDGGDEDEDDSSDLVVVKRG